ncbi:MAG: hypothetical protein IPM32_13820 [Ignavibacteriae bacterium]|nr:hypothetical protein [Ignavibacteriota bacterium]
MTEILQLLDEETIQEKIDKPIDEIFNQVYSITEQLNSQRKLKSIIYFLIQKLKKNKIIFTTNNKYSDLVWFLNQYYSAEGSQGYERAIFDINNYKKEGILHILETTSESLKKEQKEKYLQWIYTSKIEHTNWESKLKIVEQINKTSNNSSEIHSLTNIQKALYLKEIIQQQIETSQAIKSLLKPKSF